MEYKTSKGIKYDIGTVFIYNKTTDNFNYANLEWKITSINVLDSSYQYQNTSTLIYFRDSLAQLNNYLDSGRWVIKQKSNTTPNGIKYQVGTKLTDSAEKHTVLYTIVNIDEKNVYIEWANSQGLIKQAYRSIENTNLSFDNNRWTIVTKNMDITIEVGDTIRNKNWKKDPKMMEQHIVSRIEGDKVYCETVPSFYCLKDIMLFQKKPKTMTQDPEAYELLKDLPGIPRGTMSTPYLGEGRGGVTFANNSKYYNATDEELEDVNWFKPVYKKEEIEVPISYNRTVFVTQDSASIVELGTLTKKEVALLYLKITENIGYVGKHKLNTEQISLGCQTFTKEDVLKVYETWKDFN